MLQNFRVHVHCRFIVGHVPYETFFVRYKNRYLIWNSVLVVFLQVVWTQAWLTNAALYKVPLDNARWTIKSRNTREPTTGSEHLLVGMKIAIPVLPSIGSYISDDSRSCVNDDCFDLPAFSNRKFQSGKKSDFGDFPKAALYEKLIIW